MALLIRNGNMPQIKMRPTQFEQGRSITLPAPYGGINLRSDITALQSNEARVLENWDTSNGQVVMRPGFTHYADGFGTGEVKTLSAFVGYSATAMLAGANGKIYDVTTGVFNPGNDSFTKVLLEFPGIDASTTITDNNLGGSAHAWTAAGNAQIDTAQSKFGGSSLLCDGTGDYVDTPDHANFTLGSDDWTVDFWFRCNLAGGTFSPLCGQTDSVSFSSDMSFFMDRTGANVIRGVVATNGVSSWVVQSTTQFTNAVNTGWHHVAFVRSGNTLLLFIDGSLEASQVMSGSINSSASNLAVGRAGSVTGSWTGWIDEFRLSVGTARWTENFVPPTGPYSSDGLVLASGFSENRWQTALYGDRLFFVNGTDNPQVYNGSSVAGIVWAGSGLTDNDLINIALVRNRLWFCEKNKADVWYGAVGQITAASNLTKFELSQIAGGGFAMAVGSWSRDGGDGADDLTVFVMSTGELLVYQGDPGSTFSLIGKYPSAAPIGRQCLVKVGGELVVITRLGLLPLSAAVGGVALDLSKIDPWGKVAPGIVEDARLHGSKAGWHGCLHLGTLFINVPQSEGAISKQWVLNTRTGAWTTHKGRNPSSLCSFNNELYFGAQTGGIVNIVSGPDDDGDDITAVANGAFVFPNNAQKGNVFTAIRPRFQATGAVSGLIGVDTDFATRSLSGEAVNIVQDASTTPWGSDWGSPWGQPAGPSARWYSIRGEGKAVAVKMRASGSTQTLQWSAVDLLFKPGGIR